MVPDKPQPILLPVRSSTVLVSFLFALVAGFLPWGDMRIVPDFVAMVLVFWCIHEPRRVGLGTGWVLGLLVDAGNGVLLGQHALAYSVIAFGAITLSRRVRVFPILQQALHVAILLAAGQAVSVLVRLVAGAAFPGWAVFTGPLLAAVLWPLVSWLLLLPQRLPVESEERI